MFAWKFVCTAVLVVNLSERVLTGLVSIEPHALSALRGVIVNTLDSWVEQSFDAANASLALEMARYVSCEQKISDRMKACGQCVGDRCLEMSANSSSFRSLRPKLIDIADVAFEMTTVKGLHQGCVVYDQGIYITRGMRSHQEQCALADEEENITLSKFNQRCSVEQPPQIDKEKMICIISPTSCLAIKCGEVAVKALKKAVEKVADAVKKGFKKLGSIAKNIVTGITKPFKNLFESISRFRIRLPRIRLPRIRLPRIRLPRIRLPRIRLPRIRLPRIRWPRIRLPRIRLPRIRLPRIRLPRIRLPRIRVRGWKKKRAATEPTCDDIKKDPANACLFYQMACESCGVYGPPGDPQPMEQLITTVCGPEYVETFTKVEVLENRVQRLEEMYEIRNPQVFTVTSVKYDPAISEEDGHTGVRVSFLALGQVYSVTILEPVPIFSHPTAGPLIAKWIFEDVFKEL